MSGVFRTALSDNESATSSRKKLADEMRELADTASGVAANSILDRIREMARRGDYAIHITERISKNTLIKLGNDGFWIIRNLDDTITLSWASHERISKLIAQGCLTVDHFK